MGSATDGLQRLDGLAPQDVASGQLHRATLPSGQALCVGKLGDRWFAVKDHCPHAEFPLSEGTLYPTGELECCWHGARFDCVTGAVLRGPAEDPLVRYEVVEQDGALYARRMH